MFQAFAQGASPSGGCPPELKTDFGCLADNPVGFAGQLYSIGLGLIGGVALLFLIIGGYYLLTSQGSQAKIQTGKSYIFYAIAGLLLAIFGFIITQFLARDILKIPGFG